MADLRGTGAHSGRTLIPDVSARTLRRFRVELLVIAVLVLLASMAAIHYRWYDVLDRLIFDTVQRLVPLPDSGDIVLVGIDSRSLSRIGRWPWPREQQARLLEAVSRQQPSAVFVDMVYNDPASPEGDAALLKAAAAVDRLVLPVVIDALTPGGTLLEQLPFPDLLEVTDALGHVHVAPDGDGIVRGSFLREGIGTPRWLHAGAVLGGWEDRAGEAECADADADTALSIANERCDYRRIRFAGPPGTFQHVSAHELMSGAVDAAALQGRIVLIGRTDLGAPDAIPVPVSAQLRPMAGVEYNANILNAARSGGLLKPIPPWLQWTMVLGWTGLALWLIPRQRPRQMLIASTILALAPVLIAAVSMLVFGHFAEVAAASVGAALVYPLWSWRRNEMGWRFVGDELDRLASEAFRWSRRRARLDGAEITNRLNWLFETGAAEPVAAADRSVLDEAVRHDQRQIARLPEITVDPFVSRLLRIQTLADEVRAGREVSMAGIDQMPVGLCIFVASGNVVLSNAAFRQFTDAMVEHSYFVESALGALQGVDWRPVLRRAASGAATQTLECRNAGGQRFVARLEPLRVAGYAQPVCLLTLTDVTDIRIAQERRDETLAFVSHDLRSPISSILSIVRNPRLAADPSALARIESYARRSLSVSEEFVRLSRLENLSVVHRDEIDLVAVIHNAVDQLFELARDKDMHVTFEGEAVLWMLGNGELLERVVVNLIENAIKYSPSGSAVTVTLRGKDTEIIIEVADWGQGIPEGELDRVFEPYYRVQRQSANEAGGIGLGLRFVRTAVELHGGSVSVRSMPGQGSTFVVRLPVTWASTLPESLPEPLPEPLH